MKYIKIFEKFTKEYQTKIELKDFKQIKKGSMIQYMGGPVEVMDNNGYVLKLKGKDGKTFTVNKSQFDHGGRIAESKFNKKKLMKAMKKDDGMVQLGNGEEYVIYNPNNGNDDNTDMWKDKVIFGLDQDGEEHEIEYSDIVSYNESVINEEYIELMPGMEEGLEQIVEGWIEWKGGPATEKSDIAPARKELLNFCTAFLKKNIK